MERKWKSAERVNKLTNDKFISPRPKNPTEKRENDDRHRNVTRRYLIQLRLNNLAPFSQLSIFHRLSFSPSQLDSRSKIVDNRRLNAECDRRHLPATARTTTTHSPGSRADYRPLATPSTGHYGNHAESRPLETPSIGQHTNHSRKSKNRTGK